MWTESSHCTNTGRQALHHRDARTAHEAQVLKTRSTNQIPNRNVGLKPGGVDVASESPHVTHGSVYALLMQ